MALLGCHNRIAKVTWLTSHISYRAETQKHMFLSTQKYFIILANGSISNHSLNSFQKFTVVFILQYDFSNLTIRLL